MFLVDRSRVFIGSMNLDPRSIDLNTEIGLLIDNAELASMLADRIDGKRDAGFYTVTLEPKRADQPDGSQALAWIERDNGQETRYTKEPRTSAWQRFMVRLISLFPIDSQL